MSRGISPLNALRAFEATARHCSYSRAAAELNVVHTSVARHVRILEDWLDTKLFEREGRGIVLSHEGRQYFNDIKPIFQKIEAATAKITPQPGSKVRLSVEPIFMHQWFAKRFYSPAWAKKMSGLEFEIQSSAQVSNLENGDADIAIRYTLRPEDEIDGDVIANLTLYPFMAPSALENCPSKSALDVLLETDLIYALRPERWEQWFRNAGYVEIPPLRLLRQDDSRVALLATLSGNAALMLCPELAQDELEEGRLMQVSDIGLDHGRYVLLTAKGSRSRPEVDKTLTILKELLATFHQSSPP